MEKLEQIKNLLVEWQEENPEKRVVNLVATEVENENKDGYSASVSMLIVGKETILVDSYERVMTEHDSPIYSVINKAIRKMAMRGAMCGFIKRVGSMAEDFLSKLDELKDKSEDSDK